MSFGLQYACRSINASLEAAKTRRNLAYLSCGTGNPIDNCWRCDPNWHENREGLADCAVGFGKKAIDGRDGMIYVVTDSGNDDPVNPKPGTLRHAVVQDEPLWIIFERDMTIQLKEDHELFQDNRRSWCVRTHPRWALHHDPVRDEHYNPWISYP